MREQRYQFVTVTPETHRRVNARSQPQAANSSLRDAFGWSRAFAPWLLPEPLLSELIASELVVPDGEWLKAKVRFSSLGGQLYAHSAYPTLEKDAVFFGPDTYRFCAFLTRNAITTNCLVDIGCGSGAGGLCLAGRTKRIVLADINERALSFAQVNAELAGVKATFIQSDIFARIEQQPDLVVANPPYLRDEKARRYRDGGGQYGEALAVRITEQSLSRISKGGRLLLYSGSAVVDGHDTLREALAPLLNANSAYVTYEELDPDVFGEELELPYYANVDRLAAVGLQAIASK